MDSFKPVLDRKLAIERAQPVIDLACPLLREVINHATAAHQRCQLEVESNSQEEDLVPLLLYKHAIEISDGIEVLLAQSCGFASIPLVRTLFETYLSLKYIFAEDYQRRALSWVCVHIHERLVNLALYDSSTEKGKSFQEDWDKRFGSYTAPPNLDAERVDYQSRLTKPELVPIEAEYQRCRKKRKHPPWYYLFSGLNNLRDLAKKVGCLNDYDVLYHPFSGISHATDLISYLTPSSKEGKSAFWAGRHPGELKNPAVFTIPFLIRVTKLTLEHFRPGEDSGLSLWYEKNIAIPFKRLCSLEVQIHEEEASL